MLTEGLERRATGRWRGLSTSQGTVLTGRIKKGPERSPVAPDIVTRSGGVRRTPDPFPIDPAPSWRDPGAFLIAMGWYNWATAQFYQLDGPFSGTWSVPTRQRQWVFGCVAAPQWKGFWVWAHTAVKMAVFAPMPRTGF